MTTYPPLIMVPVNGAAGADAARPRLIGEAWSVTGAVTPRTGRPVGQFGGYAWGQHGYVCGHASLARTPFRNQMAPV